MYIPRTAEDLFLEAFAVIFETIKSEMAARGEPTSQYRVAQHLGLSPSTVSAWLRGTHRGISLDIINRLARDRQLPVDRLFKGVDVLADPVPARPRGGPDEAAAAAGVLCASDQEIQQGLEAAQRLFARLQRRVTLLQARRRPQPRASARPAPAVCTVSDLQRFLGMSRSTIYRFIHRGVFPSFWCGGWRIPKTALWNHRAPGQARWDIWPQICEAQIKTERVQ
jgi:transcriptional regulator with XRE-family HTH domain